MNKVERVKEFYNNGQSEYEIFDIKKNDGYLTVYINLKNKKDKRYREGFFYAVIGFYEWLINPIYKVFEVFKIKVYMQLECYLKNLKPRETIEIKQHEETLTYLAKQTGGRQ
jgi:hypothetical protein